MLRGEYMRETEFKNFLNTDSNIDSKIKAVRSRVSKARMVERHFNISLDAIVNDNDKMYDMLVRIKQEMKDTNGNISNALRKYYQFTNGRVFPVLSQYQRDE
jgi:hypothetical protein